MPFLVDSVTAELNQRNLTVHLIIHPVIASKRCVAGKLTAVAKADDTLDTVAESIMHLQITEQTDAGMLKELAKSLTKVLGDVRAAVEDWRADAGPYRRCHRRARLHVADGKRAKGRNRRKRCIPPLARRQQFHVPRIPRLRVQGQHQETDSVDCPAIGLGLLRDNKVTMIEGISDGAVLHTRSCRFHETLRSCPDQ
jgi:glutamate dehydrogenase